MFIIFLGNRSIEKYNSAELRKEKIVDANKEDGTFFITSDGGTSVKAKSGSCGRIS